MIIRYLDPLGTCLQCHAHIHKYIQRWLVTGILLTYVPTSIRALVFGCSLTYLHMYSPTDFLTHLHMHTHTHTLRHLPLKEPVSMLSRN